MPRMPQVRARELVRFLKSRGFVEDRQSGSLDPLARGAEDLRHHSDAHRSRYRAGTCDPYSQGRKITLLEVEPSIWRHSAVRLESALAKWRVLLSECDGIENRTHPY